MKLGESLEDFAARCAGRDGFVPTAAHVRKRWRMTRVYAYTGQCYDCPTDGARIAPGVSIPTSNGPCVIEVDQ